MISDVVAFSKKLEKMDAFQRIEEIINEFTQDKLLLSTSFGAEDQVLTDIVLKINPDIRIFTLDTCRQFQETYDTFHETVKKYRCTIEVFAPETSDLITLIEQNGPNSMYESIAKRKECCRVRKIVPLNKALSTCDAWVCGIRQEQSVTRFNCNPAERDPVNNKIKFSPLFDWTNDEVWEYIRINNVPYNKLHDKNFPSIGCAPCTRAIQQGENERAGRWWWEAAEQKECGLHKRQDA
jgi:phosphoadenosine phosphosulfate reductase